MVMPRVTSTSSSAARSLTICCIAFLTDFDELRLSLAGRIIDETVLDTDFEGGHALQLLAAGHKVFSAELLEIASVLRRYKAHPGGLNRFAEPRAGGPAHLVAARNEGVC